MDTGELHAGLSLEHLDSRSIPERHLCCALREQVPDIRRRIVDDDVLAELRQLLRRLGHAEAQRLGLSRRQQSPGQQVLRAYRTKALPPNVALPCDWSRHS